ncbi:unnamed protein product, partial [Darwinula stevensoni]
FIKSRQCLLTGIPVPQVCQNLQEILSSEDIKDICSDPNHELMKLLDTLCKKPVRYGKWYLDLLVALQDLSLTATAEELESQTETNTKDGNSDLANVLGRKDGRNLPLICRSLLETGHRQIAEDLLRSTKEDLTAYYVDTDVTKYHNEVLLALEREISLPHFKSPVESIKKSGGEMDQLRSLVESLKKSEEERMYQFKGIFDSLEKSKIQRADQLLLLVSYILLYVLGQ